MESSSSAAAAIRGQKLCVRYIRKGSQGAPATFWDKLYNLILALPKSVFPSTLEQICDFMIASQASLETTSEFRGSRLEAWQFYFKLALKLLSIDSIDNEAKASFIQKWIEPVFIDSITSTESSVFRTGDRPSEICAKGFETLARTRDPAVVRLLEKVWIDLRDTTFRQIETLDGHSNLIHQWSSLFPLMYRLLPKGSWQYDLFKESNGLMLVKSCNMISEANVHIQSMAIKDLSNSFSKSTFDDELVEQTMQYYITQSLPELISSSSNDILLQTLISYGLHWHQPEAFHQGWRKVVSIMLESKDQDGIKILLHASNEPTVAGIVPMISELQKYISRMLDQALEESYTTSWSIVKPIFQSPSNDFTRSMLDKITLSIKSSDLDYNQDKVIQIIRYLNDIPIHILVSYVLSNEGFADTLMRRLLSLTESSNEVLATTSEKSLEKLNSALKSNIVIEKRDDGLRKVVASLQSGVLSSHDNAWLR